MGVVELDSPLPMRLGEILEKTQNKSTTDGPPVDETTWTLAQRIDNALDEFLDAFITYTKHTKVQENAESIKLSSVPRFVSIIYYKATGKWYSSDEFETTRLFYDLGDEVREMNREGRLPGLARGRWEGFAIIKDNVRSLTQLVDLR